MKFLKKWIFVFVFMVSFLTQARDDKVPGSRYVSARSAAMADAFLSFAERGSEALFYQPAAIGKIRKFQVEFFNMLLFLNQSFLKFSDATNFFQATSLSTLKNKLADHPNTTQGGGISIFPNVAFRGFAFGILAQSSFLASQFSQSGVDKIRYRSQFELIPSAGVALRLAKGIIRIGYVLQWVNRASGDQNVDASTANLSFSKNLAEGAAFSHNVGFAMTFPYRLLPSVQVVARNVGGAHYGTFRILKIAQNRQGVPATEPMTVDAAFSIEPKFGRGGKLHLDLVGRDLLGASHNSWFKRAAIGLELSFRRAVFFRGGFSSGYASAGVGFQMRGAEFSFSYYTTDIGTSSQAQKDIRYMMQYQMRFE